MLTDTVGRFKQIAPAVDFWSLRLSDSRTERLSVRQNIVEPFKNRRSVGALITIVDGPGIGYAATSDLTKSGLKKAATHAQDWARNTADLQLSEFHLPNGPRASGSYRTPVEKPWDALPFDSKLDLLKSINEKLKIHEYIVDWSAFLEHIESEVILVTPDSQITQNFSYLTPYLRAVAHNGKETQSRSYGIEYSAKTGLEHLTRIEFEDNASRTAEDALRLLSAPDCPSGEFDLLLLPTQMALQIHESIGHPLELDRILGDERNYAGGSFVSLDMFGDYRYGSELLNVVFDPSLPHQVASFGFDDEGTAAEREYLIKHGMLLRPLGCKTSQNRADIAGVANSRACDWNRAPIDRMGNINMEPGDNSLAEMIRSIEFGILMDTNRSWSIDDRRNKFQFGCELGRVIEHGKIKGLVKNPNYRGISARFWRNLKAVGDETSYEIMGVPTCGKGEPNQAIQVGHAAPACLFSNVAVFGGR